MLSAQNTYRGNFQGNGADLTNVPPSGLQQAGAITFQVIGWNGTTWVPMTPPSGGSNSITGPPYYYVVIGPYSNAVPTNTMSGFGLFNTPLGALNPFGAAPGVVTNFGNYFGISPQGAQIYTNGIGQFTNGQCVIMTTLAYETNTILLTHHSLDGTQATVDFYNVTNGVSFTAYSSNPSDTNLVEWAIFKGGRITVQTNTPAQTWVVTASVEAGESSYGSVSPSSVRVVAGGGGGFTAIPVQGYFTTNWLLGGNIIQPNGNTLQFTNVSSNAAYTVTFAPTNYTVTTSAGANGSITPSGSYDAGQNVTESATPNAGYYVNTWTLDGVVQSVRANTFFIPSISASHTLSVTFSLSSQYTNVFNGQIAWYKMNEGQGVVFTNYAPTNFNSNDLVEVNFQGNWPPVGNGYDFINGSTFTSSNNVPIQAPLSYTAWIDVTNNGENQSILSGGSRPAFPEFFITPTNTVSFQPLYAPLPPFGAIGPTAVSSSATIPLGTWCFVAFTLDASGDWVFYINGAPSGSATDIYEGFSVQPLAVGLGYSAYYPLLAMSNVNVFNRVISYSEVTNMYQVHQ